MIRDLYNRKAIYDKNGEFLYSVSAHYKDRINYYRYIDRELCQYKPGLGFSEKCYRYKLYYSKISRYNSHHLINMSYWNIDCRRISDITCEEKMSDYNYKEKEN